MSHRERFDELWNEYLEGELSETGVVELQGLLADDALLRDAADAYGIHRLLGLLAQSGDAHREGFVRETMARLAQEDDRFVDDVLQRAGLTGGKTQPRWRASRLPWAIVAAAVVVLGVVVLWPDPQQESVYVRELAGAVQWTGNGGPSLHELAVGDRLRHGTLEAVSADAWVVLVFDDSSTLAVSGRSMLTIAPAPQKSVHLHHGHLSADVCRQPEGRPMRVHTPTAELEVVGTRFTVGAESALTSLTVNEGLVQLKRLADGRVAGVPAEHRLVAGIEPSDELRAIQRPDPVLSWRANLESDSTIGKWVSDLDIRSEEAEEGRRRESDQREGGLGGLPGRGRRFRWGGTRVCEPAARQGQGRNLPSRPPCRAPVDIRALGGSYHAGGEGELSGHPAVTVGRGGRLRPDPLRPERRLRRQVRAVAVGGRDGTGRFHRRGASGGAVSRGGLGSRDADRS